MPSSRHLGRVIVMQTIFAYEFHPSAVAPSDPEAILEYIAREFEGKISELDFAYELLNGVLHHLPEIHAAIVKHAPEWPVLKIAPVDRAILELAFYEMKFSKDVPKVVAIDEAIELAKSFGSESSPKFVNGVLNAYLKETQSAQES